MPALYKDGKNYSHNGPQVDVELTKGSPNAAPSGQVYDKIEGIQSQIVPTASIESGETASKAYNAGDFLVKDGVLYKVTNAIAEGDILTVGTNIAMTTVGGELSEIKGLKCVKIHEGVQNLTTKGNTISLTDDPTKYDYLLISIVVDGEEVNVVTHLKDDYGKILRAFYFATTAFYCSVLIKLVGSAFTTLEAPAKAGYSTMGIGTIYGVKQCLKYVKIHEGVQNLTTKGNTISLTDDPTKYDYLLISIVANGEQVNIVTHLKDDYGKILRAFYFATTAFYCSVQIKLVGSAFTTLEAPAKAGYSTMGIGTIYGVKCSV